MATPETFRALLAANSVPQRPDTMQRTKNLCDSVNKFVYKLAHEPTVAADRIQEHCYKTVPQLVSDQSQSTAATTKLNGVMYDLDYTAQFLVQLEESIQNSIETRDVVSELASKMSARSSQQQTVTR